MLVQDMIALNSVRTPEQIAVQLGSRNLTYAGLQQRVDAVASMLVDRGAEPEMLIGVPVERTLESLIAMLGVLRSGAAYVPINWVPGPRFEEIRTQASLELFVGGAATLAKIPVGDPTKLMAVDDHVLPSFGEFMSHVRNPLPDNIAYVIFTSGTTGSPKGVITSHRSLSVSTESRYSVFPLPPGGYLMLAPFSFDAASAGIYFTLTTGGRLVIPTDEEVLDSSLLSDLIQRESITHLDGVPSQYAVLLQHESHALTRLECVVLAGEALHTSLARRHFEVSSASLFNEYGPTEGTVWSTIYRLESDHEFDALPALVPLGGPIQSAEVTVVGSGRDGIDPRGVGEIRISGDGLARGYLGDPAGTALKFVPDPSRPGCRTYRTGDLGLVVDDVIHFKGRSDRMVKVRGFRVELDEVEACLSAHPLVDAAIVVSYMTADGTRIAAFIVSSAPSLSAREMRTFALAALPEYMVPQTWRRLESVPLTRHGKVDRSSLNAGPSGSVPFAGFPIL